MLYPHAVTKSEKKFLSHLRVNELEIDAIEQNTRKQAQYGKMFTSTYLLRLNSKLLQGDKETIVLLQKV